MLIQGYANDYSQYGTTPEEYDLQQYEGGSTLFGRNTTPAYQQEFTQPAACTTGQTATAVFVIGHPKNNLHRNGTFLEVQRLVNGQWTRHSDDGDWSTRYQWRRSGVADSEATITWTIPTGTPAGTYRIVHNGDWKSGWTGKITGFTGATGSFTVG